MQVGSREYYRADSSIQTLQYTQEGWRKANNSMKAWDEKRTRRKEY
jgi:hypothetical protein